MISLLCLAIFFVLVASGTSPTIPVNPSCFADSGKITICVYANGLPVANARLVLTNQGRPMGTYHTDPHGVFQMGYVGAGRQAFYFEYEVFPPNDTGLQYSPPSFYNATLVETPDPLFYAFFSASQSIPPITAIGNILYLLPIAGVGIFFGIRRVRSATKVRKGGRKR